MTGFFKFWSGKLWPRPTEDHRVRVDHESFILEIENYDDRTLEPKLKIGWIVKIGLFKGHFGDEF